MKSNITLQQLAEYMRDAVYDDFARHMEWSLSVIHPRTNDGDVGFSGGIWNKQDKVKNSMSVRLSFSETRGIYNFKAWINGSEIRFGFGETPSFEEFKEAVNRIFIEEEFSVKTRGPFERTRGRVYATGNKWAKENFDATHS